MKHDPSRPHECLPLDYRSYIRAYTEIYTRLFTIHVTFTHVAWIKETKQETLSLHTKRKVFWKLWMTHFGGQEYWGTLFMELIGHLPESPKSDTGTDKAYEALIDEIIRLGYAEIQSVRDELNERYDTYHGGIPHEIPIPTSLLE